MICTPFRLLTASLLVAIGSPLHSFETDITTEPDVEAILSSYVGDFRSDPHAARKRVFGIRITGEKASEWTVVATGEEQDDETFEVALTRGLPGEAASVYVLSRETLGKLHRGEMSILTAGSKAFSTDEAPLEFDAVNGFQPGPEFVAELLPFTFHFWTRGFPEIVPFDREKSRTVHGAQAVIFFYQPGLRLGWVLIEPGQHANKHPGSRKNPFPTFLVITKGKTRARIGGEEMDLEAGRAIFIGPNTSHEFMNPFDEPAEAVLVMFGEGA
jgi:quercetin dioxygenase-like cupin family protein